MTDHRVAPCPDAGRPAWADNLVGVGLSSAAP